MEIKSSLKFSSSDKVRAWYVYYTGNGGIAYDERVIQVDASYNAEDICEFLEEENAPWPSGFRGYRALELKPYMESKIKKQSAEDAYAGGFREGKKSAVEKLKKNLMKLCED